MLFGNVVGRRYYSKSQEYACFTGSVALNLIIWKALFALLRIRQGITRFINPHCGYQFLFWLGNASLLVYLEMSVREIRTRNLSFPLLPSPFSPHSQPSSQPYISYCGYQLVARTLFMRRKKSKKENDYKTRVLSDLL